MTKNLLLLEDDQSLIDGLVYVLMKEGYAVDVATTVAQAHALLAQKTYALLLLDMTLPDGNGLSVCESVRTAGSIVPIIFLTAMDEEVQVIRALDGGGDDYITKPFKLGELCSRIRAQLRRRLRLMPMAGLMHICLKMKVAPFISCLALWRKWRCRCRPKATMSSV